MANEETTVQDEQSTTVTTPIGRVRWWRRHTITFGALDPRRFDELADEAFSETTETGVEVQT